MPISKGAASHLTETQSDHIVGVSERLVLARQAASALSAFPGKLPHDTSTAYAIQHLSIKSWPDTVTGWKVGGISPSFLQQFGTTRLAGPIFRSQTVIASGDDALAVSVFENGFAAVEAEFVVCTAARITPFDASESLRALQDCIASVHIGAEIASSPMASINELGPGAIISDFGNNAGLIVGPSITNWRERARDDIDIAVSINDHQVGATKTSIEDDALNALEFLIELSSSRGIDLPAGTFVTCGALSGIHETEPGDLACVSFEGFGTLNIEFAKRQPTV